MGGSPVCLSPFYIANGSVYNDMWTHTRLNKTIYIRTYIDARAVFVLILRYSWLQALTWTWTLVWTYVQKRSRITVEQTSQRAKFTECASSGPLIPPCAGDLTPKRARKHVFWSRCWTPVSISANADLPDWVQTVISRLRGSRLIVMDDGDATAAMSTKLMLPLAVVVAVAGATMAVSD